MNTRPLYENLDTAFVNLSALVTYLRRRQFVGRIRVELHNYEADIVLFEKNKISVREYDKITGRTTDGEEAFQIVLIRAREPGGTIHVFQKVADAKVQKKAESKANGAPELPAEHEVSVEASVLTPKPAKTKIAAGTPIQNGRAANVVEVAEIPKKTKSPVHLPKFPFDLQNKVEAKARKGQLSGQDWQTLLGLTGELLGTIDRSLAEAKLEFSLAFGKARSEISADYPFLDPNTKIFVYKAGKVTMSEQVNANLFVSGVIDSLRRILDRLGENSKFEDVYRLTTHRILALANQRRGYYDKFALTKHLKKIVGV